MAAPRDAAVGPGLQLSALIDPAVRYEPVRDGNGRIVDFRYVELNDAAVAYNGLSREDTIGRTLLDLLPGHRETGWLDRYAEVVETGVPLELGRVLYANERQQGGVRQTEVRALPVEGGFVLTWRDVTEFSEAQQELAASEERFRLLAESSAEVLLDLDMDGRITWASSTSAQVLEADPAALHGRHLTDLFAVVDRDLVAERMRAPAADGGGRTLFRVVGQDGEPRWTELHVRVVPGTPTAPGRYVVRLADRHRERLAQRAHDALSAGNEVLVSATDVEDLLRRMCDVAANECGYSLALYLRVDADQRPHIIAVGPAELDVAAYVASVQRAPLDEDSPAMRAIRTQQPYVVRDVEPTLAHDPARMELVRRYGLRSAASLPVFCRGELHGAFTVFAAEFDSFDETGVQVLGDLARQLGTGLERLDTDAQLRASVNQNALLRAAIDQADETILVVSADSTIVYANPAALQSTGYTHDELAGQHPRIFRSGFHDDAYYDSLQATLDSGQTFRGIMVNRRKNGEVFEEDATISPVHDEQGSTMAYVAVKRDLSAIRRAEAALDRSRSDRETALDVMRDVVPTESMEDTAGALCAALLRLDQIDASIVLMISAEGDFVTVGSAGYVGVDIPVGEPIPGPSTEALFEALRSGTHWLDLTDQEGLAGAFSDVSAPMVAAGFSLSAYTPIRWEGDLVGTLAVTSRAPDAREWIVERLPVLEELGTFASMLFGARAHLYGDRHVLRRRIREVIDHERFRTVVQPVIALGTGDIVGYEALTRFDDGARPNLRFDQAHDLGLGVELEEVCARAALAATSGLPADRWVSLNFSPAAVLDGTAARVVRAAKGRAVVLEITEHAVIESYGDVSAAVARCDGARLAVDDAGAGFASLRHILELRPAMVKLDIDLVRNIDGDPARQALAAGLRHFCSVSGMLLVAEGVETQEEADQLRALGVDLAQGYLFGRPAPVADVAQ